MCQCTNFFSKLSPIEPSGVVWRELSERRCEGGRERGFGRSRRGRCCPTSWTPRVLQAGAHVRIMIRSKAQACSNECFDTLRTVSPPAECVTQHSHFALQTGLGILNAHPQLTKVFEEPGHCPTDASGRTSRPETTGLSGTNEFSRAATENVIRCPNQVVPGREPVAASASGWTQPSRILVLTRSGRCLLLREASSVCRFPRVSRVYSSSQHRTLWLWLIHSSQEAL